MRTQFRDALERLINGTSMENFSNTPDFVLANFLANCLIAFDEAVSAREKFYGREIEALGLLVEIDDDKEVDE